MSKSLTLKSRHIRRHSRAPVFALILPCLLNAAVIHAEPTGAADTRQPDHGDVAASDDTETAKKSAATASGGEGGAKQGRTPPSRASDKVFEPTEKISEDFSVPFPVDI